VLYQYVVPCAILRGEGEGEGEEEEEEKGIQKKKQGERGESIGRNSDNIALTPG